MHSHHMHREHQVSHRRVHKILQHEPAGSKQHATGDAFSNVTSKTAAEHHDTKVAGHKAPKRYARGGKVKGKHGHQTNIAIVVPHRPAASAATPPMAGPLPGPAAPMAGPAPSPMGPMPMRARGGKVDGASTKANIRKMGDRASKNSLHPKEFFRGGAATGVGREEKAEHQRRKGR